MSELEKLAGVQQAARSDGDVWDSAIQEWSTAMLVISASGAEVCKLSVPNRQMRMGTVGSERSQQIPARFPTLPTFSSERGQISGREHWGYREMDSPALISF
jgi:hypothetical protein